MRVFRVALVALFFGFFPSRTASSQDTNQYPPSTRWRELDTPHAKIVFDARLESDARKIGGLLGYMYEPLSVTMRKGTARIPIVLGGGGTANGFVSFTPRRSEFGSRPFMPGATSGLGTGDWYELLTIHEFRHVVQIRTMNRGASRLMRIGFGSTGLASATSFAVPGWYWEGDAVVAETAFTKSGRGRMPSFDLHVRALASDGQRYPYAKAMFRTYRDYYPNHYVLGYLLTSYVSRTYGPDAWRRIVSRTNDLALLPLSFNLAIRKVTGRTASQVYEDAMIESAIRWASQRTSLEESPATIRLDANGRRWTNYAHPQFLPDGSILTVESGSQRTGVLIRIWPDGRSERVGAVDPALYFAGFSTQDSRIVWSQKRRHPRWSNLEYGVLMLREVESGKERQLTHRTFLHAPALSPDGSRIAAVEFTPDRRCNIVILDSDGVRLTTIASPNNELVTSIAWMDSGDAVVVNRQAPRKGKAISVVDLSSGAFSDVLPYSFVDTWRLSTHGPYVLFVTADNGIDQINAVDIRDGKEYRVVSRRLGAYFPSVSPDGESLVFSDYSVGGLSVATVPFDVSTWQEVTAAPAESDEALQLTRIQSGELAIDLAEAVPDSGVVRRYRRIRDLFEVYSWTPVVDDEAMALAIDTRNLLNTVEVRVGGLYNRHSGTAIGFSELRYSGLFLLFSGRVQYGDRTETYYDNTSTLQRYSWSETSASGSIAVPFKFDRGRAVHALVAEVGIAVTDIRNRELMPAFDNGNGRFLHPRYAVSWSRSTVTAVNDIVPRWSSSAFMSFEHTPFDSDYRGQQFYVAAAQSIPGIRPQHVLRVTGEAEIQSPENYRFDRLISVARGYDSYFTNERIRGSVNYILPIAYPDLAIGSLFYSKRILGVAFADYSRGRQASVDVMRSSVGFELLIDMNILSIPIPVRAGVRASYLIDESSYQIQPVLFF